MKLNIFGLLVAMGLCSILICSSCVNIFQPAFSQGEIATNTTMPFGGEPSSGSGTGSGSGGEPSSGTGSGGGEPGKSAGSKCLIATAAFGSELTPQVQFLRHFRDQNILSTASGSSFMNAFNAWYYSFSPYIADYERQQPWLQESVKFLIYPLLGILSVSEAAYSMFPGEYGALVAGVIASSMIGVVYISPWLIALDRIKKLKLNYLFFIGFTLVVIASLICSIVSQNQIYMMITTSLLVLTTVVISAMIFTRTSVDMASLLHQRIIHPKILKLRS